MFPFAPTVAVLAVFLVLLPGCATAPREFANEQRAGLGTAWGEDMEAPVEAARFDRTGRALAVEALYYNDAAGLRRIAPEGRRRVSTRWFESEGGIFSYGLRGPGWGGMLPGFTSSGRNYVRGKRGDRYAIVLRNETSEPLSVVVSVDGLNAVTGRPAGLNGEAYLIGAGRTFTVPGFRRSLDEVAAFRFSRVAESYTSESGRGARNVGVIGLAAFAERRSRLSGRRESQDTRLRRTADPFPGNFARPPVR